MTQSIVFMGTPDFAVASLNALVREGYEIRAVVTNPDRRAGRGRKLSPPAVKIAALEHNLNVLQPPTLRDREVYQQIRDLEPDFFVVAAYGSILGPRYLDIPTIAPVNVHASLLPRLRGSAPIHWAIVRGHKESGVSIMRMELGMDTGGVYLDSALPIAPDETAGTLHDKLASLGASLLTEALPGIASGALTARPQDDESATYAPMLTRADGALRFDEQARRVLDRIRGMHPWPGTFCRFRGKRMKIHRASLGKDTPSAQAPGTLIQCDENGFTVQCLDGTSVVLHEVQLEGKSRSAAKDVLHGYQVSVGEQLEPDDAIHERRT